MARIFTELMTHYDGLHGASSISHARTFDCPTATAPALQPSKNAQAVINNVKAVWAGTVPPTLANGYSALNHLSGGRLDQHVQRSAPVGSALHQLSQLSATQDQNVRDQAHALRAKIIDQPGQSAIDALTYVPYQLKALGYELAKTWDTTPETFAAVAALGTLELVRPGKMNLARELPQPAPSYRNATWHGKGGGSLLETPTGQFFRVQTFPDPKFFSIEQPGKLGQGMRVGGKNMAWGRVEISHLVLPQASRPDHAQMLAQALGWAGHGNQHGVKNPGALAAGNFPISLLRVHEGGIDSTLRHSVMQGQLLEHALNYLNIEVTGRQTTHERGRRYLDLWTLAKPTFSPEAARLALKPTPKNVQSLSLTNFLHPADALSARGDGNVARGRFGHTAYVISTRQPDPKTVKALESSIAQGGYDPLQAIHTLKLRNRDDNTTNIVIFDGEARAAAVRQLGEKAGVPPSALAIPHRSIHSSEIPAAEYQRILQDAEKVSGLPLF